MIDNQSNTLFISGCTALTTDTCLDAWAMGETLAVGGKTVSATFIAIGVGIVYLALKIGFFKKAIDLAADISNPQRTISLALVFIVALSFASVSTYFNLDRLAGDKMQETYTQEQFDKRTQVKANVDEAFKQGFDQNANIKSVYDSAEQWYKCEISNACISGENAGEGPISSLLAGFMIGAKNAQSSLTDLEADIESVRAKSDHLIKLYDEVENIVDLDFDGKEKRRSEISEQLNQSITDLQALIPYALFKGLQKELGKSTAIYRSLSISDEASKRLKTKFAPFADEFERQADLMRKAQNWYLPPIKKPSRLDVFSASSDGIVYWVMSIALAFGVWIMLFIHIISTTHNNDQATSEPPHASPSTITDQDILNRAHQLLVKSPDRSALQAVKEASQILSVERLGEVKRIGDSRAKKIAKMINEKTGEIYEPAQ